MPRSIYLPAGAACNQVIQAHDWRFVRMWRIDDGWPSARRAGSSVAVHAREEKLSRLRAEFHARIGAGAAASPPGARQAAAERADPLVDEMVGPPSDFSVSEMAWIFPQALLSGLSRLDGCAH